MKKAFVTAIVVFAAAFFLLFSFQKNKNRTNTSGKKILSSALQHENSTTSSDFKTAIEAPQMNSGDKVEEQKEIASTEELDKLFREMPRTSELQSAPEEEFHETPQAVLAAGEQLANIHEYFYSHPQARHIEMSFYLKCSQQADFFDSIRAICAARLSQQYFEATGHQISAELFDKNIDSLRKKINL